MLTLKGWGVDPRPFCGEFRPDMEARVPLTLEAGGRQRHVCGSPAKGNVVQIYKYTNLQIQIQIHIHKYKLDMAGKGATDT